MEKAWIDYKTDEETFKTIMQYEEDFVRTYMKKKYGRNYDATANKTPMLKKDEERFALASLLVQLDILCVDKLKLKNMDLQAFFSKPENLMIRKLCLATGLEVSSIENIINKFPKETRTVLIYLFGINRKQIKFEDAESIFNLSEDEIYKILLTGVRRLKYDIKLVQGSKNAGKIPSMIIIDLEKKGYSRSELIKALNLYDDRTKCTLQKYYGYNYSSAKSPITPVMPGDEEIINNVLTGENNIDVQVQKLREKQAKVIERAKIKKAEEIIPERPFNIIRFYKKQGYSTLEITTAYRSLSNEERTLIEKQFDKNYNEIKDAKLTEEEKETIFNLTRSENQGIGKALKNKYKKSGSQKTTVDEKPIENKPAKAPTKPKNETKKIAKKPKEDKANKPEKVLPSKLDEVKNKKTQTKKYKSINECKTLNEFYKQFGFDDEDLESVYKVLPRGALRHFENYIDVQYVDGNNHVFKIKKFIPTSDVTARQYLKYTILIPLTKHRVAKGKNLDMEKIPTYVLNKLKNCKHQQKIIFSEYKTLNEYYEARGLDSATLEYVYSKTRTGKDYFDEYIDIVKTDNGRCIFKIKKPIDRNNTSVFKYFTQILPQQITRNHVKFLSSEPQIVEERETLPINDCDTSLDTTVDSQTTNIESSIDLKIYMGEYITSVKETNIITRELIMSLGLPKRYEYFLLNEFVANKNNNISLDEEAEILNLDAMELCKILIEAIELLKAKINNILMINDFETHQTPETDDGETSLKKALN